MPFRYPIALEVEGRRCVVIGGGAVAEQKTRALLEAGALVAVVSTDFTDSLEDLAREGSIELIHRPYSYGDLEGIFLAIAASEDRSRNGEIYKEAEERNVLLNAVDDIPHCHFAAPSIIRRGDFLLTISTGGKAPALAKKLRVELSETFGPEYGRLVDLLGRVRERMLPKRKVDFDTWAQRWGDAMSEDLIGLVRAGRLDEAEQRVATLIGETTIAKTAVDADKPDEGDEAPPGFRSRYLRDDAQAVTATDATRVSATDAQEVTGSEATGVSASDARRVAASERSEGSVSIVGAGPGDPDLITVGGRRAIEEADIVVADRLVNPGLVAGKEVLYVGKEPGGEQISQDEINDLLIRLARSGRKVVRLKGGDPYVFGRGAEEAEALAAARVVFSVTPAPTSALAAVAAAGIPVTDRRFASSVAIVTGHRADAASEYPAPDFERLATAADTIVVLMGLSNLEQIVQDLIRGGRNPLSPAAIIEDGTLPSQRVITEDLQKLQAAAVSAGVNSPAIIVVGDVVRLRKTICP